MQSRIDDYGAESTLQCLICMENHLEVSHFLEGLNMTWIVSCLIPLKTEKPQDDGILRKRGDRTKAVDEEMMTKKGEETNSSPIFVWRFPDWAPCFYLW
jgi:hypothetical protein